MCKVCDRPDVDTINADLKRMTLREASKRYGIAKETLRRHSLHMASPETVAEVVELDSRRPVPTTKAAVDRRLTRGQMLASVVERIATLDGLAAEAERDIFDPSLGLRERHLVMRTLVQIRRETRGYLAMAAQVGALDTPDVSATDAQTVADVRAMLAELERELEAANG